MTTLKTDMTCRTYYIEDFEHSLYGARKDRFSPRHEVACHLHYKEEKMRNSRFTKSNPLDYHLRLLPRNDKEWAVLIPMDEDYFFREGDRFAVVKNVSVPERIRLDREETSHVPVVEIVATYTPEEKA